MPLPPWVSLIPGPWPATDPDQAILDLAPAAWWRFHDGSYSDAGVTLCVADDPIYRVVDKSGNGSHITQATLGARPLWKPNVLNGKAVGRFDGLDDWMGALFTHNQPCHWFVVFKQIGNLSNNRLISGGAADTRVFRNASWFQSAGTNLASGIAPDSNFHVWNIAWNSTTSRLRVDGVDGTAGNAGTSNPGGFTAGAVYGGALPTNIDFAEAALFPSILSESDRDAVESHLASYYGITIA